jgi:hypothetical protein
LQNEEVFDGVHVGHGVVMRLAELANFYYCFKIASDGIEGNWARTEKTAEKENSRNDKSKESSKESKESKEKAKRTALAFNSLSKSLRLLRQSVWPSCTEIELVVWPDLGDGDDDRKSKARKKPFHRVRLNLIG